MVSIRKVGFDTASILGRKKDVRWSNSTIASHAVNCFSKTLERHSSKWKSYVVSSEGLSGRYRRSQVLGFCFLNFLTIVYCIRELMHHRSHSPRETNRLSYTSKGLCRVGSKSWARLSAPRAVKTLRLLLD